MLSPDPVRHVIAFDRILHMAEAELADSLEFIGIEQKGLVVFVKLEA